MVQAQPKETEITVTLAELLNSQKALQALANEPMPARCAFKFSRILKAVAKELETCDETRLQLCERYGGMKQEDGSYKFSEANEAIVNAEFTELIKTEVTIRGERLDLDGLPDLTISAASVVLLGWLVE